MKIVASADWRDAVPFENPVRVFAPSFAASFVIVLILVGSGAGPQPDWKHTPRQNSRTARTR